MAKKIEVRSDLKVTMEWFNLNNKELGKLTDWLEKVPVKPQNHSEE